MESLRGTEDETILRRAFDENRILISGNWFSVFAYRPKASSSYDLAHRIVRRKFPRWSIWWRVKGNAWLERLWCWKLTRRGFAHFGNRIRNVNAKGVRTAYRHRQDAPPDRRGRLAEIDLVQMAYLRRLTPAERVQRAASMIDAAERVGVYRLRQRQPELSEDEAYRIIRGGLLNYQRKQGRWRKSK